jgi:hypothetical protein
MSIEHSPARDGRQPLARRSASTINEFCEDNRISRTALYKLWAEGRGPRYFLNGTHRRITDEAGADWRRDMEAAATAAAGVRS